MKNQSLLLVLVLFSVGLIAQPIQIFYDDFESGSFDPQWWTTVPGLSGQDGVVAIQNEVGLGNSFGVALGKSSDGDFTTNALDLHLELQGEEEVEMTFWISDRNDNNHALDGLLFSDDNGLSFVKVLDFAPEEWCNNQYGQYPPIDIDQLAFEAELELNDQFIIRFQQYGEDDFSGGTSSQDGLFLDNVNVYNPNTIYSDIPFVDDFEMGVLNTEWSWSFADLTSTINTGNAITSPMNLIEVLNGIGVENTFGVRMGRRCDGPFVTNALDLHLDLSGEQDVEMTFWIATINDNTQADDGLYFSDDGGNDFKKVMDFTPDEWCNSEYGQHPPVDVDGLALAAGLELTEQFIIRFQQHGEDDFVGGTSSQDGIYIDNVNVYDPELLFATLPFDDDFNTGNLKPSWAWNFANESSMVNTGSDITSPMNFVGIINDSGLEGSPGVRIGRICDGELTANALDLHLDLEGNEEVEMTFWIGDNYDNDHLDDGIYFSNDGGVSFKKVLAFIPEQWCDNLYGHYPPIDVDALAEGAGLALTNQFVIRFQQMGEDDFVGGTNSQDGFYLDEVNVYVPVLEYSALPFMDNFDLGQLGAAWKWRFADSTSNILSEDELTTPMNIVEVENGSGVENTFAVKMGRRCDGTFVTNALDLHLNLLQESDVRFTFELSNNYDDSDIDDGIYLSNDGGDSFSKVYEFDFANTENSTFLSYDLNLDSLADIGNIDYTDKMVVRFQQRGSKDFIGGTSSQDGIYLDNINILSGVSSIIKEQAEFLVNIYPNPVTRELNVELISESVSIDKLYLINSDGSIARNMESENALSEKIEMNISALPAGLYLLKIHFENGDLFTKKIIKL